MVKKGLLLGTCLLLIIGLLGVIPKPALAAPGITLDPAEGLAPQRVADNISVDGTIVNISGAGFAPLSAITVTWNGGAIATDPETVETEGDGSFGCKITVPVTPYGEYSVAATDEEDNSAEATFFVLPTSGEKVKEGVFDNIRVMIALPAIINEILNDFFDLGHLRLTDRGNEFVNNMVTVISDGAKYAAQWLEEKLGG